MEESVLSFQHLESEESLNSGVRIGGKCLHPLNHLVYPVMVLNSHFVFALFHLPVRLSFLSEAVTPCDSLYVLHGLVEMFFLCCCLIYWLEVDLHATWPREASITSIYLSDLKGCSSKNGNRCFAQSPLDCQKKQCNLTL